MSDAEERPRLRWRLLTWSLAALVLAPLLCVAMWGPLRWWALWHENAWQHFVKYDHAVDPFRRDPAFGTAFSNYEQWWLSRRAPRSWRREALVQKIAKVREDLEDTRVGHPRLEAEVMKLHARLRELSMLQEPMPVHDAEAAMIELKLRAIEMEIDRRGRAGGPQNLARIAEIEETLRALEQQLRQLDAQ